MKTKILSIALLVTTYTVVFAQANAWVKIKSNQTGNWNNPALVYSSNTKEFLLTMGQQNQDGTNNVYSVQSLTHKLGKWINSLPNDTLYGKWADSTGFAYGKGAAGQPAFGSYYWTVKKIEGYLRINIGTPYTPKPYNQFCYNTDDGKIYYYIHNTTFTYNPVTRLWDTLSVSTQPTVGNNHSDGYMYNFSPDLKWGALCYDSYNKEIVLFGGVGLDNFTGSPGTWTFKPSTKTWTKLNPPLEPGAIAYSAMVYDPDNKKIVLFGGDHLDKLKNETWVYDCITRTWSKKNPSIRPSPRAGHAMLFMPKSRKVVLIGGYNYQTGNIPEMWTYDVALNTWKLIKRFGTGELSLTYAAFKPIISNSCVVGAGDTLIALADSTGDIYSFHPQTYRMACNPTVVDNPGTSTYGFTTDTEIYYGTDPAYYTTGVAAPDTAANEAFLRNLPLNTWTKLTQPKIPLGERYWSTTVLDTDRDIIIKWSGGHASRCDTDVPQYSIAENRFSSGYWPEYPLEYKSDVHPAPGPFTFNGRPFMSTHPAKQYAYDVISHQMVYAWGQYTWLYNPDSKDWIKNVHIYNPFNAYGFNAGLCSTPAGVYCVCTEAGISNSYLFDAAGKKWNQLPMTGEVGEFFENYSTVVYDSKRDRIIFVHSFTGPSDTAKVYEYSIGTGIAKKLTVQNPQLVVGLGAVAYRECVYVPELDVIFFQVQSKGGQGHLVYDCANNAWTTRFVKNFTSDLAYMNVGSMYDPKRKLIWVSDAYFNTYVARLTPLLTKADELTNKEVLSIVTSPNPFSSVTTIAIASGVPLKNATLQVFNIQGKLVADLTNQLTEKTILFNADGLSEGLYVIRFRSDYKTISKKISYLK